MKLDGWGPWRLHKSNYTLVLADEELNRLSDNYWIDLDECTTSAGVLDWVCQIAGKTWASDAVLAGLVRALDDVLCPQAHLCSGGQHKTMASAQVRKLVKEFQ